jgi:hypothetical protein
MGRESRLARRPGPVDNRGTLDRAEGAICTLLDLLKADPRVGAEYTAWFHRRDLGRLMSVPVSDSLPELKAAAERTLFDAVLRDPTEDEIAAVRQVLETIGPGRSWPRRWAARVLVETVFPTLYYNVVQRPDLIQPLYLTVRDDGKVRLTYGPDDHRDEIQAGGRWVMTRRGNRPQEKGHQKVRDAVQCWYQAYCQDPPVPKPKLTKKYAERENRVTDAHSVVDDRIELAETLLNRLIDA